MLIAQIQFKISMLEEYVQSTVQIYEQSVLYGVRDSILLPPLDGNNDLVKK